MDCGLDEDSRVSQPVKPTADWNDLSPRQQEVAKLLAKGLSVQEMSQQMHLARPAIKFHMLKLFNLTGSNSRASLLAWIEAHGPTGDDEDP